MQSDRSSITPLLVFGGGRVGTTLLMQLLATSNRIAFDRAYPFEVRRLTDLLQRAIGQADFEDAWCGFAQETDALYYAEKLPNNMLERVKNALPFKLIVLTRDPRDVFLSVTAFNKKRGFAAFNRLPEDDDWTYARRVVEQHREFFPVLRAEVERPDNFFVRYEDLVTGLAAETARLSDWLGVALDHDAVERDAPQFADHMTASSPQASVERWRREMTPELNDYFRAELKEELKYFGYEA